MQGVKLTNFLLQNWGRAEIPVNTTAAPILDAQVDQPGRPIAIFVKTSAACLVTFVYGAGTGRISEIVRVNGECRRTMLASHVAVTARSVTGTATVTAAAVTDGAELAEPAPTVDSQSLSVAALGTVTIEAQWRRHIRIVNTGFNIAEVRVNGFKWDTLAVNGSVTIEDYRGAVAVFSPAGTLFNVFQWGV